MKLSLIVAAIQQWQGVHFKTLLPEVAHSVENRMRQFDQYQVQCQVSCSYTQEDYNISFENLQLAQLSCCMLAMDSSY